MFLDQTSDRNRLPVVLLSGFLGSGKTTLVNALLQHSDLAETAVFINEFGEVPLDQLLVRHAPDATMVIGNGCLCCNLAGDMEDAVMRIFARRDQGDLPQFKRVIMEPSGLADPAPIAQAILRNPVLSRAMRLSAIITTVDCLMATTQQPNYPEFTKQVALADTIVLTKPDMVDDARTAEITTLLRNWNPDAPVLRAEHGVIDPRTLLPADFFDLTGPAIPRSRLSESAHIHHHAPDVTSVSLIASQPLPWRAFETWLRGIRISLGDKLLRVKGMVHVAERNGPVVVQGVHHVLHAPVHWHSWPDDDHRTRLVLILRSTDAASVDESWLTWLASLEKPSPIFSLPRNF